ncbi:MAG: hypothetical protein WCY10_05595, partial [Candidatus Omnitrophota bacterium]
TLALAVFYMLTIKIEGLAILRKEAKLLVISFWGAVFSGTVLNAVLLPYLPGRAFSLKGGILGSIVCAAIIFAGGWHVPALAGISSVLMASGISAFLALNFTGASTYTSLSGVKKEIRYSIPVIIALVSAGALLEIIYAAWRLL